MRLFKYLYLALGIGLLAVIVAQADLSEVSRLLTQMGWGFAFLLALYLIYFSVDVLTWMLASTGLPSGLTWFHRLWRARLVGEAFNAVVPAGGMGGEPVKAEILKQRYGVRYRDTIASIVLAKTVNMIALVLFATGGFALMVASGELSQTFKTVAGAGLAGLAAVTVSFFAFQRLKLYSATARWMGKWSMARGLLTVITHIHDVEEQFVRFYDGHRARFSGTVMIGLMNWFLGAGEVYFGLAFLGHEVTFAEAWMIESVAQLVRAGTFFIPSSIGAQEGAFAVMCAALVGSVELGVAMATVRRLREIVWIGGGMALAAAGPLRGAAAAAPGDKDGNNDSG